MHAMRAVVFSQPGALSRTRLVSGIWSTTQLPGGISNIPHIFRRMQAICFLTPCSIHDLGGAFPVLVSRFMRAISRFEGVVSYPQSGRVSHIDRQASGSFVSSNEGDASLETSPDIASTKRNRTPNTWVITSTAVTCRRGRAFRD